MAKILNHGIGKYPKTPYQNEQKSVGVCVCLWYSYVIKDNNEYCENHLKIGCEGVFQKLAFVRDEKINGLNYLILQCVNF